MLVADVKGRVNLLAQARILKSYFYTIHSNLETGKWGEKYPRIMNDLFNGKLRIKDVPEAKNELFDIKDKLQRLDLNKFVYDLEDPKILPPENAIYNKDAKNMYEYFINPDGRNITEIFLDRCDRSLSLNWDIIVYPMLSTPDERPIADQENKK